ncbi:protein translocase subunit SecF [Clostridium frigidicarnis]|uniref:Protein-export membrane protein SecF n=1 Tax=Clostridium frigidicarnis TaxID=84698 RepID=A0A1I0VKH5_9CLOT|nr:protein translocase subunit SecF [Clostridium frigidicarnis]SFA76904.1 protein translocase subunit secF [Clostridium frigidicarnis]
MLKIIEKTKIWFAASLIIIIIGLGFIITKGFNFGIDFKGGTQVVIDIGKDFDKFEVEEIIKNYANDVTTNKVDGNQIEIKSNNLDSNKVSEMFKEIKDTYSLEDSALISQDEIGATIGKELAKKSVIALIISTLAILIYVAIRFEFKFGSAAVLALIHDVLITVSVYAIFQIPINTPFIAAILSIVGYSINDTIVIFDRIRENQKKMRGVTPTELANVSITQTIKRSINTSLTTVITISCVYAFVPSIRDFAFPLLLGIICGAYSSIFIASPLWVIFKNKGKHNTVKLKK